MTDTLITIIEELKYVFQNQDFNIIADMWFCGPPEKNSNKEKFPGAYPTGFRRHVIEGFAQVYPGRREDILFVCSGRIPQSLGITLDINPECNPEFVGDAQNMDMFEDESFSWVESDTPYNKKIAKEFYDIPMLDKSKVMKEMVRVTKVGGFVAVFDESIVTAAPRILKRVAIIGVTVNPNKQIRAFTVYRKLPQ